MGVTVIVPPGRFTLKAGVVPNGLVPLQSNSMDPEDPAAIEETGALVTPSKAVSAVQLTVIPDTAGIAGNVCVKRLVAA